MDGKAQKGSLTGGRENGNIRSGSDPELLTCNEECSVEKSVAAVVLELYLRT